MACGTLIYQSKVKKWNGESYNHSLSPPNLKPDQGTQENEDPGEGKPGNPFD